MRLMEISAWQSNALATSFTIDVKRCLTLSKTSGLKVRIVPEKFACCGMILKAVPESTWQTETTALSKGGTFLDKIVCKAVMICAAATTGSTPWCGEAACAPLPSNLTENISAPAITGPFVSPYQPTGLSFQT